MECKFCKKQINRPSKGYCVSCYQYFILHEFDTWYPSQYGELARVNKLDSNQYMMPICHICGRAYTKLQQHIYYSHNMTKDEYCDKFGLDRKINMTTPEYNKKMHDYALYYDMDKQLIKTGVNTRFESGHKRNYKRSHQTLQRLSEQGKVLADFSRRKSNA